MADEQIKKTDLFEPGFLDEVIKSAEILNTNLEKQNALLKETAKMYADLSKNAKLSARGIKDIDNAEKSVTEVQKEKMKVDRDKIKLEARLKTLNSQKIQQNEKLKVQISEQRKANKQLAREELKLVGAYEKLSKKLIDLRKKYKDLLAAGKGNEKGTKALGKEVEILDRRLKDIDAQAGQFQRNVGNYPKTFAKVGGAFRQLTRLVGQFGIALGGVAVARDAFNVVVDFDQAMANLKAISGATTQELGRLETQAKQLGSTTSFTASEVAGLQTEFAKLGFKTNEIEQATESTLNFAKATGADLASAASLSGSALRAFNLDASEAARVNSVLGVATTKTALDFSKLENGLSTVAPVANAFGFSIEETTALLGQLSNAGFDASSSATATRNILLNLADANGSLAKELGRPVRSAKDLAEGLKELDERGIDLASALELTDKRSVAAFQTFLQGADDLVPLTESLTNVEDELKNIADIQDNTLQGSINRLRSAWEGYILGTNGATGASDKLRKIIDFLAENLDTIIDTVIRLGRVFFTFRTALFLTNKVVIPLTKGIKQMSVAFTTSGKGIKGATTAFKSFNNALKANVIGIVSVAVFELIEYVRSLDTQLEKSVNNAAKALQFIQGQIKAQQQEDQKFIDARNKSLNEEIEALEQKARLDAAADPTRKKEIEAELQTKINQLYNDEYADLVRIKSLQDSRIKSTNEQIEQEKLRLASLKIINKNLRDAGGAENTARYFENLKKIETIQSNLLDLNADNEQFEQIKKDLSSQIRDILKQQEGLNVDISEEKLKQLNLDKSRSEVNKKELNDLELARLKLKEKTKLREGLIIDDDGLLKIYDEEEFQRLTNEIERLKFQIENAEVFLEDEPLVKLEPKKIVPSKKEFIDVLDENVVEPMEDAADEIDNSWMDMASSIEDTIQEILQAISESIDRQIELLDKQVTASKDRQDQLRDIAINGRGEIAEDAKKSLAQEEAKAAQAEARKAQLEKRQQVIAETRIVLENIGNLVEQGMSIEQATAKSFSAIEIVKTLLSGLSGFYDGTDDTGTVTNPLDNKGGRLAILHDNEQVWSKKDREKVGFKTRDEVIQAAQDGWKLASEIGWYQSMLSDMNGVKPMTEINQINAFDTSRLEEEVREVKAAIKNMKFPHGEAGEITDQFFRWISSDGRGNKTIHSIKKPRL